jgi:hypothetical protein
MSMTPKEQYEARKAERKQKRENAHTQNEEREMDLMELLDRFVTAAERIADALERPKVQASNLTFDPNSASGFKVANTFGGNQ